MLCLDELLNILYTSRALFRIALETEQKRVPPGSRQILWQLRSKLAVTGRPPQRANQSAAARCIGALLERTQ